MKMTSKRNKIANKYKMHEVILTLNKLKKVNNI